MKRQRLWIIGGFGYRRLWIVLNSGKNEIDETEQRSRYVPRR